MDDALWISLVEFTRAEIGRSLFGTEPILTRSTRLEGDLGLTGIDAIAFIDTLFEKFNVKGEPFPYARYFGGDGAGNLLAAIPALIRLLLTGKRQEAEHSLNLGMLLDALRAGRWDTEAIEARQKKLK